MTADHGPPATAAEQSAAAAGPILQAGFDDLYSAVYDILDDAKTGHDLVKLYKGSHGSPDPHPVVLDFGEFFFRQRRGLIGYACQRVNPDHPPSLADLDAFDAAHQPRVAVRPVFEVLGTGLRRRGETVADVLAYVAGRTHDLGAYRGGSSGYDDETRAFIATHFSQLGVQTRAEEVLVFCGGAKGAFMAFCAALMCRRRHDDLQHLGGLLLTPAGYYQSLRLIPPVFGGDIHVTDDLTGHAVRDWLAATAGHSRRCVYVPLVNNADGKVLSAGRAHSVAAAVLEHNAANPGRPVYVLADDVYAGSYLEPGTRGLPIASVTGAGLGNPGLGRMSDWTLTVLTSSKTFALPTARVAFTTTTNPVLRAAVAHYRTVLSQGRVPQASELTAAAAICLTPQCWIDRWNSTYRKALHELDGRIHQINTRLGFEALTMEKPEGGWYLPLRVSPRLIPAAASGVDAFAVLLHYGGTDRSSGIALLPGELFGYRAGKGGHSGFMLRGTLAAGDRDLRRFTARLGHAAQVLTGPQGPQVIQAALSRARAVADVDTILANCRY
jgi:aspartate/methionine/tyrosine aminotransferase